MPAMLSSTLWHKTGRFDTMGSELYKVRDRRNAEFLLAPTFEEEITKLVGEDMKSARDLPIKLYQTTKKYRDEPRPRSGLLRTKEFLMNDLYTFDADLTQAMSSYSNVQEAYLNIMSKLFGERHAAWRIAEADTGSIGGSMSHEYQVEDDAGEDTLFTCSNCDYVANVEMASSIPNDAEMPVEADDLKVYLYGSHDLLAHGCSMTAIVIPKNRTRNEIKIRRHLVPGENQEFLRFSASWDWKERPEGPMIRFDRLKMLLSDQCRAVEIDEISQAIRQAIEQFGSRNSSDDQQSSMLATGEGAPTLQDYFQGGRSDAIKTVLADVIKVEPNDKCAKCKDGDLRESKAIEVAHTFLLGSKYTDILGYKLKTANEAYVPIQMGCYGIGITRIMGVLAQQASRRFNEVNKGKGRGFIWDPLIAPFSALIMPIAKDDITMQAAQRVSRALQVPDNAICKEALASQDIAIDDRKVYIGSMLADADLVGYPIQCILGKSFQKTGEVEVRQYTSNGLETRHISLEAF